MNPDIFKKHPQVETVVEAWKKLKEDEQKMLIPYLLHSMPSWRAWTITSMAALHWLEERFKAVDVPFRSPLYKFQEKKYRESMITTGGD